jgi:hypothetical protein
LLSSLATKISPSASGSGAGCAARNAAAASAIWRLPRSSVSTGCLISIISSGVWDTLLKALSMPSF